MKNNESSSNTSSNTIAQAREQVEGRHLLEATQYQWSANSKCVPLKSSTNDLMYLIDFLMFTLGFPLPNLFNFMLKPRER